MGDALGFAVGVLTMLTMVLALIGLAIKYALLPWLRDQLVTPVQETHKQVTVNSYKSESLTLLDLVHLSLMRIQRIEERVDSIEQKVDNAAS